MAVKNPDFRVKHGLRVGGSSTLTGGLSCLENATFQKNLTVNGDLVVEGDTTTLNTTAIEVEDPLLSLGSNNTTNTLDIGFYGQYSTDGGTTKKYAGFFRDADDGIFKLFADQTTDPSTGNVSTTGSIAQATLSANVQGNASTSTKWQNAMALSFAASAPLAGTVTFDGSSSTVTWGASFRSGAVDSAALASDAVTNAKVANDAIDTAELKDNAVTSSKIGSGAVDTSNLAGDAVTTAKIASNAVTSAELNTDAVTTDKIADNQVTNAKMADDSVGMAELSADAVRTEHIQDGTITFSKLSANAVTTSAIDDLQVTTAKVAASAITHGKLAGDAVEADNLADGAVTSGKIGTGAVTTAAVGASAVTHAKLAGDAVEADNLATDAVITGKIANDAVTNAKIANDYISINGNPVSLGGDITVEGLSSVIDTASIDLHIAGTAGNAILSADVKIADTSLEVTTTGGITGLKVKDGGIVASHLANDAVTTSSITDGAVTNAKLAAGAVSDAKISLDHGQFVTLSGDCLSAVDTDLPFDTTVANDYNSVNYYIQGKVGTDYQSSYITLLHNDTDVWIMEHGIVHSTEEPFLTFDADLSGTDMRLLVNHTHTTAGATASIKALKQGIKEGAV